MTDTSGSFDVTVTIHHEGDGWWAESDDMPGWSAASHSKDTLLDLVREGVVLFHGVDARYLVTWSDADDIWATDTVLRRDRGRMIRTATMSIDGLYRYRLGRYWGTGEVMVWAMLNPSTADANVDDPTIRRCMGFARREGYDGIEVINVYALRATKPAHLLHHPDPEGPDNVRHWDEVLQNHKVGMVVAAWGAHIGMGHLPASVAADRWRCGASWRCLGTTNDGYPRHPLYVKEDTEMEKFRG